MQGVIPALDAASTDINSTFIETMARMGQISPSLNIDVQTEGSEDLVEQAKRFAEEQTQRMADSLQVMPERIQDQILRSSDERTPLLATGADDEDQVALGTIYAAPKDDKVDFQVLTYAAAHEGAMDVSKTSQQLGIPQDVVEQSMIHLVAEGKVRPGPSRSE